MQPLFKETNRLRLIRRVVAGYACLLAGMFDLFGLANGNVTGWKSMVLFVCLVISGGCNLLTTKAPDK